jgi:hypothetical protein
MYSRHNTCLVCAPDASTWAHPQNLRPNYQNKPRCMDLKPRNPDPKRKGGYKFASASSSCASQKLISKHSFLTAANVAQARISIPQADLHPSNALTPPPCLARPLALASEQASHVEPFDCGTDTSHASDDFLKTIEALHSGNPNSGSPAAHAARAAAATGPITVDAIFHIVVKESSKSSVTNSMPSTQLKALNDAYAPYNI